jgi:hypothetical protein
MPLVNARLMTLLIRNAQLHVVDDGHLFIATRAAEMAQLIVRSFLTIRSGSPVEVNRSLVKTPIGVASIRHEADYSIESTSPIDSGLRRTR